MKVGKKLRERNLLKDRLKNLYCCLKREREIQYYKRSPVIDLQPNSTQLLFFPLLSWKEKKTLLYLFSFFFKSPKNKEFFLFHFISQHKE